MLNKILICCEKYVKFLMKNVIKWWAYQSLIFIQMAVLAFKHSYITYLKLYCKITQNMIKIVILNLETKKV